MQKHGIFPLCGIILKSNLFRNQTGCNRRALCNFSVYLGPLSKYPKGNRTPISPEESQGKKRLWTVPNALTASRMLLTPVISYLIFQQEHNLAFLAFTFCGVSDLVDGYIARRFNQQSALGSILDPLADKLLMTTLTVTLAITGQFPISLMGLIVARDLGLIGTFSYYRWNSLKNPNLKQFFNPHFMTVQVKPSLVSKWNTALQLVLVGLTLGVPVLDFCSDESIVKIPNECMPILKDYILPGLWWSVALTTVGSTISYANLRYKVLKQL